MEKKCNIVNLLEVSESENIFLNTAFLVDGYLFNASGIAQDDSNPIIILEQVGAKGQKDSLKHLKVIDHNHIRIEDATSKMESLSLLAAAMAGNKLGFTGNEVVVSTEVKSLKVSLS